MTGLSDEQKSAVAEWFAAGAGVAEIQKRISAEFGIDLTYLDVRLMVADLPQPAEPAARDSGDDKEAPAPDSFDGETAGSFDGETADPPIDGPRPDAPSFEAAQSDPGSQEETPLAELSVSVDPLAPPGAIACGSVVFSDGTSGKWMLDQMGRLGLSGLPEGYRPSPEDGAQFQPKLLAALRAKGLV